MMKFACTLLVLMGSCLAEKRRVLPTDQTAENTGKRALLEGNAGIEKRAPILPTALPPVTPGIEYATKGSQPAQSNSQDDYTDALPESLRPAVAKISDLLAGQGSTFPAAIHNHLISPVSAYQQRLVSPPTYEVSAPVPSHLAYSEHKISYQPVQYKQNTKFYQQFQLVPPEQVVYSHPRPSQQIYAQQIPQQQRFTYNHGPSLHPLHLNQPIIYSSTQVRNPPLAQQPNYLQEQNLRQQIPQQPQNPFKPTRIFYPQNQPQPIFPHGTGIPSVEVVQSLEPGIVYAKKQENQEQNHKELKAATVTPVKLPQKQIINLNHHQFNQPQGAVSYASFSVGPPAVNFLPQQPSTQAEPNHIQQQPIQGPYNNPSDSYQPLQIGLISNQPFQQQPQFQYQALVPKIEQEITQNYDPQAQPIRNLPQSPRVSYFRPGLSLYRNFYIPDSLQSQKLVFHNPSFPSQSLSPIALPPVQFYGKFAHSIFGAQYQQQQPQQQQISDQQQPSELHQPHSQLQQQHPQSQQQHLQLQQQHSQLQQQQPQLQQQYPQLQQQYPQLQQQHPQLQQQHSQLQQQHPQLQQPHSQLQQNLQQQQQPEDYQ